MANVIRTKQRTLMSVVEPSEGCEAASLEVRRQAKRDSHPSSSQAKQRAGRVPASLAARSHFPPPAGGDTQEGIVHVQWAHLRRRGRRHSSGSSSGNSGSNSGSSSGSSGSRSSNSGSSCGNSGSSRIFLPTNRIFLQTAFSYRIFLQTAVVRARSFSTVLWSVRIYGS